jgi:hypothetical protein
MPLDANLADQLTTLSLTGQQADMRRLGILGESLLHGGGIIQNLTIQENATQKDDPGLMAALNAAERTPVVKTG